MRKPVNANIVSALSAAPTAAEIRAYYDSGKRVLYCPPRVAAPSRQHRERDLIRVRRQYRENQRSEFMRGHDA